MGRVSEQTKNHVAIKVKGDVAKVLKEAHAEVEQEEDEHLYHTKGWCRELWIESLGMKAVIPPPEEVQDVDDAISAAKAEKHARRWPANSFVGGSNQSHEAALV